MVNINSLYFANSNNEKSVSGIVRDNDYLFPWWVDSVDILMEDNEEDND